MPQLDLRPPPDPAPLVDPPGVAVEAALLRAVIRRLAANGGLPDRTLKTLAELRQHVLALCTTLKTERALAQREDDAISATLAAVLESLGDELILPE